MPTFSIKLLSSLVILVIGVGFGLFPILVRVNGTTKKWLAYGETFAGGVFLGAGLIHLLPDAQATFASIVHVDYPFVYLICALSILFLRIVEEGSSKLFGTVDGSDQVWLAYLLTILLSIHAVLAGAALGIETTYASFLIIFIAIIAHKGSAAFALGVSMRKSSLDRTSMLKLMFLFAVMTPVGIIFGSGLSEILQAVPGHFMESIFNAIAAGTFIYIAAFHSLHSHDDDITTSTWIRLSSFAFGLLLMAVIAIWL